MRTRVVSKAAIVFGAGLVWAGVAPASGLQPYQMSRSLQLVQDRIASGDHAAMPMQRKLIEMIDERLRQSVKEDYEDPRNFNALMIYGMSGGNPSTFEAVVGRLDLDEPRRSLAHGVRDYVYGNLGAARSALLGVDQKSLSPELGAFLALVMGSVLSGSEPRQAVALFDRARLLSPGTLVEEAALRRAIVLHIGAADADRFILASSQYARRFLRSPYASQFAQSLVTGAAEMFDRIDRRAIGDILSWMTQEQAQTIYLRMARQAAIDGHDGMLEFASAKARQIAGQRIGDEDIRSLLYSSISSVTSDSVDQVLIKLSEIDGDRLSADDRVLLDAAKAIAAEVVKRPRQSMMAGAREGTIEIEPIAAISEPDSKETRADRTETDALVTSARSKIEAIDRMLNEDPQ